MSLINKKNYQDRHLIHFAVSGVEMTIMAANAAVIGK